jgi:hypothetical protein
MLSLLGSAAAWLCNIARIHIYLLPNSSAFAAKPRILFEHFLVACVLCDASEQL